MQTISPSELIINEDGSIFHLHIRPDQLADKIILCGDQDRVALIASHFSSIECDIQSREFHTITGLYNQKRISIISTGIGCDNCDIVLTELDALKNIDFSTRTIKNDLTSLEIIRIGTCGGLQDNTPIGTFIISTKSIGFDGLLNFYKERDNICDLAFEQAFLNHMNWQKPPCIPYVINNNKELIDRIYQADSRFVKGYTIACGGFYGPQCRQIRTPIAHPDQNTLVASFEYEGLKITNYEMESSAIAGLSALLGHKAMTICLVVAGRKHKQANTLYKNQIDDLIKHVLERF